MKSPLLITLHPYNAISLHQLYRHRRRRRRRRHHNHHRNSLMGMKPRISTPAASTRRLRRKTPNSSQRVHKPEERHRIATYIGGGASVSDKLEALKSLIPSESPEIKPEQLFQETADYIALLKTQVFVLQKLIDFYGSQNQENRIEN